MIDQKQPGPILKWTHLPQAMRAIFSEISNFNQIKINRRQNFVWTDNGTL